MVKVVRSTVIDAPIEAVWQVLRDFNSHDQWHGIVAESHIENGRPSDEIGCVRKFRLQDGAELREQLITLSDRDFVSTYCILESPIPLLNYVATVTLKRVTDGNRTYWDWRSSFATPKGREQELATMVGRDVYEAGFAGLRNYLKAPGLRANHSAASGGMPARSTYPRGVQAGPVKGKAIMLKAHGGPEQMVSQDVEAPPPGLGEVRLKQSVAGVNYIDVYVRTGAYPFITPPGIPGMEAAGQVIDVGSDVTGILPGDRVAYASTQVGAYASVRTMPAKDLVVLPNFISEEIAAAIMLKGMTAEYLLHRTCQVKPGDVVLVHAAAGGVGLLACQWARHIGATVIGTVSSDEKARVAREAGCEYPIVTRDNQFAERVREITHGKGAKYIFDGIGKDSFAESLAALAVRGHLVSYGAASGAIPPVDLSALSAKSATITRPVLFHYTADANELRDMARHLFEMVERGVLKISINHRYPLAAADQAHRDLESRKTTGSVVLLC